MVGGGSWRTRVACGRVGGGDSPAGLRSHGPGPGGQQARAPVQRGPRPGQGRGRSGADRLQARTISGRARRLPPGLRALPGAGLVVRHRTVSPQPRRSGEGQVLLRGVPARGGADGSRATAPHRGAHRRSDGDPRKSPGGGSCAAAAAPKRRPTARPRIRLEAVDDTSATGLGLGVAASERSSKDGSILRRWWFWTAVGALALAGGAVYYATGEPRLIPPSGTIGTVDGTKSK